MTENIVKTITYSKVGDLEIRLDLYTTAKLSQGPKAALVFFHGGGMVTGGRKTLVFQKWLIDAALKHNVLFISADYRLILPSTGLDIVEDVKTLFAFLAAPDFSNNHLPEGMTLDANRLVVCGESGGGYAARAAGIFAKPKPKAIYLQYAMGGELLDDHWLNLSTRAKRPDIPREAVAHLLDSPQQPISYDPMLVFGEEPISPEAPQSMRGALLAYWLNNGELLDYILGEKVSSTLRQLLYEERLENIPGHLRKMILQSQIDESFPPTFLLHGQDDSLIWPEESRRTYHTLQALGVEAVLREVEGAEHTLAKASCERPKPPDLPELADGAKEAWGEGFMFLLNALRH